MEPRWTDDEELLAELSAALAEADVPPAVRSAGQVAWDLHDLDRELAQLVYDSALEPELPALARSSTTPRTLVYRRGEVSVELQVSGRDIFGQLVPPGPGRVETVPSTGAVDRTAADDLGRFHLRDVPAGPVQVRCLWTAGATLTISWTRLPAS